MHDKRCHQTQYVRRLNTVLSINVRKDKMDAIQKDEKRRPKIKILIWRLKQPDVNT